MNAKPKINMYTYCKYIHIHHNIYMHLYKVEKKILLHALCGVCKHETCTEAQNTPKYVHPRITCILKCVRCKHIVHNT